MPGSAQSIRSFPPWCGSADDRAVAETNVAILVRQKIGGVLTDMTSYARFLDRLERISGAWRIVRAHRDL